MSIIRDTEGRKMKKRRLDEEIEHLFVNCLKNNFLPELKKQKAVRLWNANKKNLHKPHTSNTVTCMTCVEYEVYDDLESAINAAGSELIKNAVYSHILYGDTIYAVY